jgi:hypothetical protein
MTPPAPVMVAKPSALPSVPSVPFVPFVPFWPGSPRGPRWPLRLFLAAFVSPPAEIVRLWMSLPRIVPFLMSFDP